MGVDAQKTLADLVVEQPNRAPVFERLGIDFCCGGKQSLSEACAENGLDVKTVVQTLDAFEALAREQAPKAERDWSQAALAELCDHIQAVHHQYLREHLPRARTLVETVHRVHGANHPELAKVADVFAGLSGELLSHIDKEERDLFPLARQLETQGAAHDQSKVAAAVEMMEDEHEAAGAALKTMRGLTGDYTPPEDACHTYRSMLEELEALERDVHYHIHKENNILFPRARTLLNA